MKGSETRLEIVRIGAEIIGQGGFNATGIEAVLRKAGVPKGSFYYYFSSKDDFGLAVIDQHAKQFAEHLESFLKNEKLAPLDRLRKLLDEGMSSLQDTQCKKGCLIGNLGQEMAGQSEKFRKRIEEVFRSWKEQFAECLEAARRRGEIPKDSDCERLADFLLTGWEGAILRAKVMKSPKPVKDFISIFFEKVLK